MKMTLPFSDRKPKKRANKHRINATKARWAVHYLFYKSDITSHIANAVNMGKTNLEKLTLTPFWEDALDFWGIEGNRRYVLPARTEAERKKLKGERKGLEATERLWTEMIIEGHDLFPSEAYYRGHPILNHEEDDHFQITVEALQTEETPAPPPRFFFWVHDAVAANFAIGLLIG